MEPRDPTFDKLVTLIDMGDQKGAYRIWSETLAQTFANGEAYAQDTVCEWHRPPGD